MFRSWQTLRSIPRLRALFMIVIKHGFGQILSQVHLPLAAQVTHFFKRKKPHAVLTQPQRLRKMLEEMGPTFIKFGQMLATRPDLIPVEYVNELNKLQDHTTSVSFDLLKPLIQKELGQPLETLFADIDPEPIGSASIAQVHKARLHDGRIVVIKCQRPGIRKTIAQDLQILALVADILADMEEFAHFDPPGVLRLFERSIRRELDFRYERHQLDRVARNLDSTLLSIPTPIAELSSRRVLTMSYFEGQKVKQNSLPPELGRKAAEELVKVMFRQIFVHGLFHADPHPGNLLVAGDGRLCFLDFGSVGRLDEGAINELTGFLMAIIQRNYRLLSRRLLRSGHVKGDVDLKTFTAELLDCLDPYYGLSLSDIEIAPLLNDCFALLLRHRIRVPDQYVLLARALMILENTIHRLDPSFNLVDALKPHAKPLILSRWKVSRLLKEFQVDAYDLTTMLRDLPRTVGNVLDRLQNGNLRTRLILERTDSLNRRLDRLNVQIPMGLLASSLFLGGTVMLVAGQPSKWMTVATIIVYTLAGMMGIWMLRPGKK